MAASLLLRTLPLLRLRLRLLQHHHHFQLINGSVIADRFATGQQNHPGPTITHRLSINYFPLTVLMEYLLIYGWERLTPQEEKYKLLAHHPHSEDKIGCGLDSIMVDRHPRLKHSRCLFVVRTDGGWIDFSYQKCPLELTYVISTLLKQKDL